MEPENSHPVGSRTEPRIALAFCIAVMAVGAVAQIVRKRLAEAGTFGLEWLPFAAAGYAVAGIMLLNGREVASDAAGAPVERPSPDGVGNQAGYPWTCFA